MNLHICSFHYKYLSYFQINQYQYDISAPLTKVVVFLTFQVVLNIVKKVKLVNELTVLFYVLVSQ